MFLKIWKLRDRDNPYRMKLDRNGNPELKPNGKPKMEIDAVSYINIDDAFGFYQSKFTTATKPLIKQGYVNAKDHETIEYMKDHRDEFDNLPPDQIKHYCGLELVFLSKALTVLRDGFDKMGIKLPTFTGAGSAAGALITKEELKRRHYSLDITVTDANATSQQKQSHLSFIGGRIEPVKQGHAMHRELWLYDVASAYPSAMMLLPSMKDGTWRDHGPIELRPKGDKQFERGSRYEHENEALESKELERVTARANMLSMFRVKWNFPAQSLAPGDDGRDIPFNPFPYRTKRGNILFPSAGHAWIMCEELAAGLRWMRRFGIEIDERSIKVEEWHEFIPSSEAEYELREGPNLPISRSREDRRPYAFVAELYEMRRLVKTQKEYDIVEKCIKLCINSLYGKTVQSVGGTEDKPPACACPYYGSAITANCRARLLDAALLDPFSIVTFMTDGIVSTRELKGLPNVKEVSEKYGEPGDPAPAPGVIINLGDWEFERMEGGFFLQSGVYCIIHKSGKTKDKTRGANPMNFVIKKPLKDLMINDVLPEWRRTIDDDDKNYYRLNIEINTYVTAGSACVSDERFKLIGRWSKPSRWVDIHNTGTKRVLDVRHMEYYYSGKPHSGKLDMRIVKDDAEQLDASIKDVAECLRSGEALRCRFLVPFRIKENDTPDELSAACKPEWYDPDRDDDDDYLLTKEDKDTAEILIGNH
jgi:hypothetical protein